MDGRAYLEKLVADSLGAGRGRPAQGRHSSINLLEIRGVAIGLVAAGALAQADAERILADLEVTLQRSGQLKVVQHRGMSTSTTVPEAEPVAAPAGRERPEWRQAIESPRPPMLRRVVPLVGRTLTVGNLTASLVSLEVWSTFVAVGLAYIDLGTAGMRDRFGRDVLWRGWDDVGTQYQGGGGSGSGSAALFLERVVFHPGPPEHARELTLLIDHPGGQTSLPIPLLDPRSTIDSRPPG